MSTLSVVYLFSQRGRDYDYNGGDTQRGAAEMKRHVMINKRILIMLMAFVMAFTGVFTITSAGTYAEDQGPVHLLMVDNQSVNQTRSIRHFTMDWSFLEATTLIRGYTTQKDPRKHTERI